MNSAPALPRTTAGCDTPTGPARRVDHGSLAPIGVLQEIFSDRGIEISEEEARRDMGVLKKDHIRALLGVPRIAACWEQRYQQTPGEKEVESLFADFVPHQMACLMECSTVISGVTETVAGLHDRGLKIGRTTGYTRPLMEHAAASRRQSGICNRLCVLS